MQTSVSFNTQNKVFVKIISLIYIALGDIDGKNMWTELTNNFPSRRDSFIYNIDPYGNYQCINSYGNGPAKTEAIR